MSHIINDARGNIAMIGALCFVPLAAVAGFAVDYNRANSHKVALQHAVDLAALSAAKLPNPNQQELDSAVATFLAANFQYADLYPNLIPTVTLAGNDLTVSASVDLDLVMAPGDMGVSVSAVVEREHGLDAPLEFTMVMDTTQSMNIVSNSWDDAVDTISWTFGELVAGATTENPVNITFMPISDRVNIGTGNADWLSGPAPNNWNGCVEPRYTPAPADPDTNSPGWNGQGNANGHGHSNAGNGVPHSDNSNRGNGNGGNGQTQTGTSNEPGMGWVLDTTSHVDAKFDASVPGQTGGLSDRNNSYPHCPDPVTGPTSNLTTLTNAVTSARASGTGRFDLALAWAWRRISQEWAGEFGPSGYPAESGTADKLITIVTDSHTTAWDWEAGGSGGNRPGGYAYNTVPDFGFAQIEALCEQVKNDDVEIAVLLTNSYERARTPWENCASENMFFEIENIDDFRVAMAAIANRYVQVRLKS